MVWEVKKYRLFFLFLRRRNFTAANVTSDGGMTCSGESCHAILSGVGALLMMLECVKKRERERERERERGGGRKVPSEFGVFWNSWFPDTPCMPYMPTLGPGVVWGLGGQCTLRNQTL